MKLSCIPETFGKAAVMLIPVLLSGSMLSGNPGDPVNLWSNAFSLVNQAIFSSPAIGPSGTVVFGTRDAAGGQSGNVYGFNPDGTIKWKYPFLTSGPDWFDSSPAIARDGTVYIGCWNNYLYAIDNGSGNELWRFNASVPASGGGSSFDGAIVASPAIGPDGTIYVGSMNGFVFAIGTDGLERWDTDILSPVLAGAVLNPAGDTLYVGDDNGRLHAVDTATGQVLWSFDIPPEHDLSFRLEERGIEATPAIDAQGNILFTSVNGYLYSLSPDGMLQTAYAASDSALSSPVIDAEGRIYFSSRDNRVYCLQVSTEGLLDILWDAEVGEVLYSGAAIDDAGNIVLAAYSGTGTSIYCYNAAGQQLWSPIQIPTVNDSSINISPDGAFYVGGYNGRMYKFEGNGPLAMAGWPRQGASRRQTGKRSDIYSLELIDYFPDITEDFGIRSYVPWFGLGLIEEIDLPDIGHIDHGKIHIAYSDSTGIILWDYDLLRWLIAFRNHPNYLYDIHAGRWLYHVAGTSVGTGRWFYDFTLKDWIEAP